GPRRRRPTPAPTSRRPPRAPEPRPRAPPTARAGPARPQASRPGRSRPGDAAAGQQVVRGQVLERREGHPERSNLLDRDVVAATIEERYRPAQAKVAGGPRLGTAEVTREVPVGGPLAEAADGGQAALHLVVRQQRELLQVEVGARDAEQVLR